VGVCSLFDVEVTGKTTVFSLSGLRPTKTKLMIETLLCF
jgi:hypothetical protein